MKSSKFVASILASALLISPSFAEAPLPAGKPAGSHDAALLGVSALTLALVGGFATLIIVAGAGGFSSSSSPSQNTTTATTTSTITTNP
jgi:hypothetical protein